MTISNERLEFLRKNYLYLADNPTRAERGMSDAQHAELIAELQQFRRIAEEQSPANEPRPSQAELKSEALNIFAQGISPATDN